MRVSRLVGLAAAGLIAGLLVSPASSIASTGFPLAAAVDHQSITGPLPAPGLYVSTATRFAAPRVGEILISSVPAYAWRHGCGPTAVGMVVGYWDALPAWPELIPGAPQAQGLPGGQGGDQPDPGETDPINQAIASVQEPGGAERHFEDYALPFDDPAYWSACQQDRSAGSAALRHPGDSIADFMRTSWSSAGNQYGWSWDSDVGPGFCEYVQLRYPTLSPHSETYEWPTLGADAMWSLLQRELGAGHPVVALVDSNGDAETDHFVTIVGCDGGRSYACYDTWDASQVHWYRFRPMQTGKSWGVFSLHTFHPDDGVAPVSRVTRPGEAWHNHPVTVSFSATDNPEGSGVFAVYHKLDNGAWQASSTRTISSFGLHTVTYAAADMVGNEEANRTVKVGIEKGRPLTLAPAAAAVASGGSVILKFGIRDPAPSCRKAAVTVAVQSASGETVWRESVGLRAVGPSTTWYRVRCTFSLPVGQYRYAVYARDIAGNPQGKLGGNVLSVT